MDRSDKADAFAEFLAAQGTAPERVAYMGDDLIDLPVLLRLRPRLGPGRRGGRGAGAEHTVSWRLRAGTGRCGKMCELVLRARGEWEGCSPPI